MTSNKVVIWRCGELVSSEYVAMIRKIWWTFHFSIIWWFHSDQGTMLFVCCCFFFVMPMNFSSILNVKAVNWEWNSFEIQHKTFYCFHFIPFRLMAHGSIMVEFIVNNHLHTTHSPHSNEIIIYVICLTLSNGTKIQI